jgi:hypothetical protein
MRPILALLIGAAMLAPAGLALAPLPSITTDPVLAFARQADALQAAQAGLAVPASLAVAPGAPSGEALALLAQHGLAPTPAQVHALGVLDGSPAGPAVAGVLAAFAAFDSAARVAEPGAVLAAREALLEAVLGLRATIRQVGLQALGPGLYAPPALALEFAGVDSVYAVDIALVLDAGGDDLYLNNAGGSNLANQQGCETFCDGAPRGAGALADFAGADRYVSGRGGGINGGGFLGAGFLVDFEGNDLYRAANDATNGGGYVGVGLLLDVAGDDRFEAGGWGANGGGYPLGLGQLLDLEGDDAYTATFDAVNGGGRGGFGLLRDEAGLDWYWDQEGGTGWDVTVVPKEVAGAQVDHA